MAWLISVLGEALTLAGAASLANGIPYIRLDWGQAETVAGTVAVSGGLVTLALGAVLFALRDGARRFAATPGVGSGLAGTAALSPPPTAWGEGEPSLAPAVPEPAFAAPARAEPAPAAAGRDPAADAVESPPPLEAPTVVGRYEANGASYVLFSDGTIEVETETGTHRFASMEALKAHIERQGAA